MEMLQCCWKVGCQGGHSAITQVTANSEIEMESLQFCWKVGWQASGQALQPFIIHPPSKAQGEVLQRGATLLQCHEQAREGIPWNIAFEPHAVRFSRCLSCQLSISRLRLNRNTQPPKDSERRSLCYAQEQTRCHT
eukprot:5909930-Amphidinium_carterae.1